MPRSLGLSDGTVADRGGTRVPRDPAPGENAFVVVGAGHLVGETDSLRSCARRLKIT